MSLTVSLRAHLPWLRVPPAVAMGWIDPADRSQKSHGQLPANNAVRSCRFAAVRSIPPSTLDGAVGRRVTGESPTGGRGNEPGRRSQQLVLNARLHHTWPSIRTLLRSLSKELKIKPVDACSVNQRNELLGENDGISRGTDRRRRVISARRRIVVTGGAGFIGSTLTDRLLSDGSEVTAVDGFDPFYPRAVKDDTGVAALRARYTRRHAAASASRRGSLDRSKDRSSGTCDIRPPHECLPQWGTVTMSPTRLGLVTSNLALRRRNPCRSASAA